MKNCIFILGISLMLAGGALAVHGEGTVVGSFPLDISMDNPTGITYDGSNFWVTDTTKHYLYKMTSTGSIISSYDLAPIQNPAGVTWDGSAFWIIGGPPGLSHTFYHVNTSGSILSSMPGVLTYPYPYDEQYLGGNCWVSSNNYDRKIYLHSLSNGAVLSTIQTNAKYPAGLCYDGSNLLVSGGDDGWTYRYSTTGSYMDYFLPPFVSIDYQGGSVWVNSYMYWLNNQDHIVYQISINWNPPAVEPASLGVVRSLFQ